MVYAFIIASMSTETGTLLHSYVYDCLRNGKLEHNETYDWDKSDISSKHAKLQTNLAVVQKNIIKDIVQKVKKEYDFNSYVSSGSPFGQVGQSVETYHDSEFGGIFSMKIEKPAVISKVVLWHSLEGVAYILVCDKQENRILGGRILLALIRRLQAHIQDSSLSPLGLLSKIDIVSAVVYNFLPNGQLLFLHQRTLQQMDKEFSKLVS